MRLAIDLAKKCSGFTFPNPPVGCVIVEVDKKKKLHKIISFGQTQKSGRPHAEYEAIKNSCFNPKKEYSCYISLEPCCHIGRQESCVSEILKTPIKNVIFSIKDPDKRVNGRGYELLKKFGISVKYGLLRDEAFKIYKGHFLNKVLQRPKVTLKIASSLDGKISGKGLKWITNKKSREFVHRMRFENDAILVGANTVRIDNPRLDCRIEGLKQFSPIKVVISKNVNSLKNSKIFSKYNRIKTYIISPDKTKKEKNFGNSNVETIKIADEDFHFKAILKKLCELGISNILVEGGSRINSFFLDQKVVDEIVIMKSNFFIGNNGLNMFDNSIFKKNISMNKFTLKNVFNFDNDVVEIYESKISQKLLDKKFRDY